MKQVKNILDAIAHAKTSGRMEHDTYKKINQFRVEGPKRQKYKGIV